MAFESLSEKLQSTFKKLKGKGKLTEKDVKEAMREVRMALLEADVNFKIVKEFIADVSAKAVGDVVMKSLTPGQSVIKLVSEELTELMGSSSSRLTFAANGPTVLMLVGLQGAGKTTTAAKLASSLRKQGKSPLLVACDIHRPAAIKQLQTLGKGLNIPVYEKGTQSPVKTSTEAIAYAKSHSHDLVIVDTAGRLHIDDEMMGEVMAVKAAITPQEVLLVVDAMTGQDAVNVAEAFSKNLGIDGIIMTKLDSDARGGAALSMRKAVGKPIKFVGMGEKTDELEPFIPERMAQRILGMGDVLTLIEKAQSAINEEEAKKLEQKFRKNEFDLEDFLGQMQQIKKMGPLKNIIDMLPGASKLGAVEVDDKALSHVEAIIQSMTAKERQNPSILNGSRKKRIASGSGRSIQEVNRLLKQFEDMKKMMKQLTDGGMGKRRGMGLPFFK